MERIQPSLKEQPAGQSESAMRSDDFEVVSSEAVNDFVSSGFQVRKIESAARFQETPGSRDDLCKSQPDFVTCCSFLQVWIQPATAHRPVGRIRCDSVKAVCCDKRRDFFGVPQAQKPDVCLEYADPVLQVELCDILPCQGNQFPIQFHSHTITKRRALPHEKRNDTAA